MVQKTEDIKTTCAEINIIRARDSQHYLEYVSTKCSEIGSSNSSETLWERNWKKGKERPKYVNGKIKTKDSCHR